MNQYELAVLRILLKSAAPLSKSKVINGFPDDSLDFVLSAISDLKLANFIASRDEGSSKEKLELVKEKKKDVLALISPSKAFQDAEYRSARPLRQSKGSGNSTMWIVTTLMIFGSLNSVYLAYTIGVNDRIIASNQHQPQLVSDQDVGFDVVQMLDASTAGGIMVKPAWQLQSLERYPAGVTEVQPSKASIIYYYHLAPTEVLHRSNQLDEGNAVGTYTFSLSH